MVFSDLQWTPRHVDTDGDLILYGHGEKRRRIDLKVRERCGDRASDVLLASLGRHFE